MQGPSPAAVPESLRDFIVCRQCDGLYYAADPQPGEYVRCPDCHEPLQGHRSPSKQRVLAAALSGAIFVLIAATTPVLSASFGSLSTQVNALSAPAAFAGDAYWLAAGALALVSLAVPLVQVLTLSWMLCFALARRRAPGFSHLIRLLQLLRPWAMVEVFFLGTLVVIVKVGGWVSMSLGPGLFALGSFTLLLATVHRFDATGLWSDEERS